MFQKGNKIVLTDGDSLYRNKYRGKKAKIEAINRYAGIFWEKRMGCLSKSL